MADNKEESLSSLTEFLNIDRELARYYLQKMRWNVEAAINEYYADTSDVTESKPTLDKPPSYEESEGETSQRNERDLLGNNNPSDASTHLKLLCWNIDGLDEENLEERTAAVVQNICLKKPDVVFLQEVVPYSLQVFQDSCIEYIVLFGDYDVPYFNAILLRKSTVQTETSALQFVPFATSNMGRHLLIHPITFAGAKIILMTSHLESRASNKGERITQLKEVLNYMNRQQANFNVVFGGDTNLRDREVVSAGGLPGDIQDAYESCGSPWRAEFTWELTENDNIQMPGRNQPRLRFDRIFLRSATGSKTLTASSFKLIGKERLETCGRFASDHWAIWLEMRVQ